MCDFVVKQKEYFRNHMKIIHMAEMCAMRFCGKTKRVFSSSCEDNAYDGNVPNAIMWKHKKILFENM